MFGKQGRFGAHSFVEVQSEFGVVLLHASTSRARKRRRDQANWLVIPAEQAKRVEDARKRALGERGPERHR